MGFKDTGAMWRAKYDMEPDAFAAEMERLWQQVKPLYDSLYTYTRRKLSEKYGKEIVPPDKPIPAHLLGNMWAQTWGNIYPLLAPATCGSRLRFDRDTQGAQHRSRSKWSGTAKGFLLHSVSNRCRRLSGNVRCLPSPRTAKWFVTPAPGTSITKKTCA